MRWTALWLGIGVVACDNRPTTLCDDCDTAHDTDTVHRDDTAATDDTGPTSWPDDPYPLSERSCTSRVEVTLDATTVEVAGEWTGWTPQPMERRGDTWRAEVDLPAGDYAYKLLVDGVWEGAPPPDAWTKWLDGTENRNLRVGDCHKPLLQRVSAEAVATGRVEATIRVARAAGGAPLDPSSVQATLGGVPAPVQVDATTGDVRVLAEGLAPGKHTLRVWAADTDGVRAEDEPLFVPLWVEDQPRSWQDLLLYFVLTDRFRNGDYDAPLFGPTDGAPTCSNFQGGDFLGVIHALDEGYFDALGVSALWISPPTDNPEGGWLDRDGAHLFSGYHGYWPVSADVIEERYGDASASAEARFDELIAKAHARGIRVVVDLVLNHVHEDHTYVAEHPSWFTEGCICGTAGCDWDAEARTCQFVPYLLDLDYRNHDVLRRVVDDTLRFVERHDIDGLRIDAAKHMDHVVMRTLRKRLEEEMGGGAPVLLLGETFTFDRAQRMEYVSDHELHGQFDFSTMAAVRDAFVGGGSFRNLWATAQANRAVFGDAIMAPFAGNHDVDRLASTIHGAAGDCWSNTQVDPMAWGGDTVTAWDTINRMSMALAYTLTQPGMPLLYYGDEIGLAGVGDPDNRRLMHFDPFLSANQRELRDRVRIIGTARAQSAALRRGEAVELWVDDDLLVYGLVDGDDVAVVAMNKSDSPRSAAVALAALPGVGDALLDAKVPGRTFTVTDGTLDLQLGGWDYAILKPAE